MFDDRFPTASVMSQVYHEYRSPFDFGTAVDENEGSNNNSIAWGGPKLKGRFFWNPSGKSYSLKQSTQKYSSEGGKGYQNLRVPKFKGSNI